MTVLSSKQTAAVVKYLDGVVEETRKLGEPHPLVADLAAFIEEGKDFEEIKLWLTQEGIIRALFGQTDLTGLCGGLLCGLNMVEIVVEAEVDQVFKSEYLRDYSDENRGRL